MELASTRPANAISPRKSDNGTRRSFELASTRSSEEPWAEDAHASR